MLNYFSFKVLESTKLNVCSSETKDNLETYVSHFTLNDHNNDNSSIIILHIYEIYSFSCTSVFTFHLIHIITVWVVNGTASLFFLLNKTISKIK